jgi:hypothetical protein
MKEKKRNQRPKIKRKDEKRFRMCLQMTRIDEEKTPTRNKSMRNTGKGVRADQRKTDIVGRRKRIRKTN